MKKRMITTLAITSVTLFSLQLGSSFVQAAEIDVPVIENEKQVELVSTTDVKGHKKMLVLGH
ncbi:hypothetical protein [Enterococcus avium]|uniref:hypothetical protein n=1 Tax=Enterococcus avium TaxID=33945 RepID=UPI0032E3D00C